MGHRIVYVSKHSTLEFGKDIVTVSPEGVTTAYQLKAGDINLNLWRDIRGEVFELVEVPVRKPSGRRIYAERCFLVTSGVIDDTVKEQLSDKNEEYRESGRPEIEVIERDELVRIFCDVFEEFLPANIGSFNELVRLYLSPESGPVDKKVLWRVLKSISSAGGKKKTARALSALVVTAEFAAGRFRRHGNHISVIDIWTMAACRISQLAGAMNLPPSQTHRWLELCQSAIDGAATSLTDEAFAREDWGDPGLSDLVVAPYRRTVVLGYIAARINSHRIHGTADDGWSRDFQQVVTRQLPLQMWGEGTWNYYLNIIAALLPVQGGDQIGTGIAYSWLSSVTSAKSVESPYWTIADALGIDEPELRKRESRRNHYSVGPAMDLLSRRLWRQALRSLWPRISRSELTEVVPDALEDAFEWHLEDATVEVHLLPIQGSWSRLRRDALAQRSELFRDDNAWLLPYMLCVYPHRVSRSLSGELDYRTTNEGLQREWQ